MIRISNQINPITYNEKSEREQLDKKKNSFKKEKIKKFLIISSITIIILAIIGIIIYFFISGKENVPISPEEITEATMEFHSLSPTLEKKKIESEPGFSFKTEVGQLNAIEISQNFVETIVRNGKKSDYNISLKRIYHIYVISESEPIGELKYSYSKLYTCAISVVAECETLKNENCELQTVLDLIHPSIPTGEETNNLEHIYDLKDIPIPLCLFNITDNNGITSIKCHKLIEERKIKGMILDLYFYRPPGLKRVDKKKNNITIDIQTLEGGKTFIRETNGGQCRATPFPSFCWTDMNTTKDSEENLLLYKERAFSQINQDSNNYYIKDKYSIVKDMTEKNNTEEAKLYKKKMEELLEQLNPYMKYYEEISEEQFKEIYDISVNRKLPDKNKRKLNNQKDGFYKEENIFNYADSEGVNIFLSILDDSSLNSETMKAKSLIKFGEDKTVELVDNNVHSVLTKLINKITILSKAGNHLANELYQNTKNLMKNITSEIEDKIKSLNKLIAYENITKFFDTSLILNDIENLPFTIVEESKNLFNNINLSLIELNTPNSKKKFNIINKNIYDFLAESHRLIGIISNNLENLGDSMKSEGNRLTQISLYYAKKKYSNYSINIQNAKEILENYYKNEATFIKSNINSVKEDFENYLLQYTIEENNMIKQLYQKLENKNFFIDNADEISYQNTIKYLNSSADKINDIVSKINSLINKELELKGDYFLSEYDINSNNISFSRSISKAEGIADNFDNNKFIDETFDETMKYLRQNFSDVLLYMNRLIEDQFQFEEEVLSGSLFSKSKKNEIEEKFMDFSRNTINDVKNEIIQYEKKINFTINDFLTKNEKELNDLISDLYILFSNESLIELAGFYDIAFNSSLITINNSIENNKLLAKQYFADISGVILNTSHIMELLHEFQNDEEHIPYILTYINKDHYNTIQFWKETITAKKLTNAYLSKYYTYKANFEYSEEYLKNQLNIDFINSYKLPIIKLRKSLQSIKNNNLGEKYSNFSKFNFKEHKKKIDILFSRLEEYLSDDIYNNKYNNASKTLIKDAKIVNNEINDYIESINKEISKGTISSNLEGDYCFQFHRIKSYYCKNTVWEYSDYSDDYCLPISKYADNYLNLKEISIKSDKNLIIFNNKFNDFYSLINKKVEIYNSKIDILKSNLTEIEKEIINKKAIFNYFSSFKEELKIIFEKFYGDKLIKSSYNYYQIVTKIKIEKILNSTVNKWTNVFEKLKEEIKKNKNNYTSPIFDLLNMASMYNTTIISNISRDYFDSILFYQKNEFNYTISYYYDYLYRLANFTHNYIINRILTNKYNFNYFIEQRKKLIDDFFEDLIKNITLDKKASINYKNQLNIIGNEEQDFFHINIKLGDHLNYLKNSFNEYYLKLILMNNNIPVDQYSLTTRMYLENLESGKEINLLYNPINNEDFIILQEENFKEIIINNKWVFNFDEFVNEIEICLFNLKNEINEKLSIKREEYSKKIEKILNNYFTKTNIIEKTNLLYNDGIMKINNTLKNNIMGNINQIINNIIEQLSNERENMENAVSFNTDESVINNTIKTYKKEILNKLNETIIFILNDFNKTIDDKFYKNYSEICFNKFYEELKIDTNKEYNFLNFSINFKEFINKILADIQEEYKTLTKKQLIYLYNRKLKEIYDTINLEEIKALIDNKIDSEFEIFLLPKIREKANKDSIYDPYNLNEEVQNKIRILIEEKINNIKDIINSTKGDNYNISFDFYNWTSLEDFDFTQFETQDVIDNDIINDLDSFIESQSIYENNKLNYNLEEVIKNNFNNLLNYLIPSFGKNYFERILKYNENFKIIRLYNNLRYSLSNTLAYYINLCYMSFTALPRDLKIKLYNLNNLESIVDNSNEIIKNSINDTLNEFINSIQDYIIKNYTTYYLNVFSVEPILNQKILSIIKSKLSDVNPSLKKICKNTLNKYLKEPFIKSYLNIMNEKTNEMFIFVDEQKETIREYVFNKLIIDSDSILNITNENLEKLEKSINEYKKHFKTFSIDNEMILFLNNYGKNNIQPLFAKVIDIINKAKINSKNSAMLFLNENSKKYEESFNLIDFLSLSDDIYFSIKNKYIDNLINNISLYESNNYKEKLEEEKMKYEEQNYRRLEEKETKQDIENRYRDKIVDKALDFTFDEILSSSDMLKTFIDYLNEFNIFKDKIEEYRTAINDNYEKSQKILLNKKEKGIFDNELYEKYIVKLESLQNMTKNYYSKIRESYENLKNYLQGSINDINMSLYECFNITSSTFKEEYNQIKKEFLPEQIIVNYTNNELMNGNVEYSYDSSSSVEIKYIIDIISHKDAYFFIDFEFLEDEKYSNEIIAKIINLSGPKKMKIKKISEISERVKRETFINADFGNSNYTMIISFNTNSTKINVTTITNFEHYSYSIKEFRSEAIIPEIKYIIVNGIAFPMVQTNLNYNSTEIGYEIYSVKEKIDRNTILIDN